MAISRPDDGGEGWGGRQLSLCSLTAPLSSRSWERGAGAQEAGGCVLALPRAIQSLAVV